MSVFGHIFGHDEQKDIPDLLPAIDRAISGVEPLLKQISSYPHSYRKPVAFALEYARSLAASLPGPVIVSRESYAKDAFVHALFPAMDTVSETLCSSMAVQDYRHNFPASNEIYALMGMRRNEKTVVGMEMSGQTIQRDVVQKAVYFTSHTLENPAPSERQARDQVAWSFFDNLVGKVKKRVELRKQHKQSQMQDRDMLMARLRTADAQARPALEEQLAKMLSSMQSTINSLELSNYIKDFEAVLLNPEKYLRLVQTPIILDSMGIRQASDSTGQGEAIIFNDLIGFDRRNWTVTMVHCNNMQSESFATRLERASRKLAL
jgi:hypothetical protein